MEIVNKYVSNIKSINLNSIVLQSDNDDSNQLYKTSIIDLESISSWYNSAIKTSHLNDLLKNLKITAYNFYLNILLSKLKSLTITNEDEKIQMILLITEINNSQRISRYEIVKCFYVLN